MAPAFQHVTSDSRQQHDPALIKLACDINAVSHEVEPSLAAPCNTLLGSHLVADDDVAAVADVPAQGDGAQAKIEFFPAEKQFRVVTARLLPGLAQDCVSSADIGNGVKAFGSAGQQAD